MSTNETPTPTRGVLVEGLDKPRHLRYSWATRTKMLAEFAGEDGMKTAFSERPMRVLLFGLQHEDPNLTEEALAELVDLQSLPDIMQAMAKAMGYKGKITTGDASPNAGASAPA